MCAKVLTNTEKGKSLSAKLKKQNKRQTIVVRNVLAESTHLYWPKLNETECLLIKEKLHNIFLYAPPATKKWSELKKFPKDKRKEMKSKALSAHRAKVKECNIVFGVNAVTRAVENKDATIVMLADDINPEMMVKHIIQTSNLYNISVAKVPTLRLITKECFGFSAIAVAFTSVEENNPIYSIAHTIKNFIPPITPRLNTNKENITRATNIDNEEQDNEMEWNKTEIKTESKTDPYLYRESNTERCFVPIKKVKATKRKAEESLEFIPFAEQSDPVEIIPRKRKKNISKKNKTQKEKPATQENSNFIAITKKPKSQKVVKKPNKTRKSKTNDIYKPLKIKRLKKNEKRRKSKK